MMISNLAEKILDLKKEKNAIILAHFYQPAEIQDLADYVGDSYYLSEIARDCKEEVIVFCGVKFMAESAKILSPEKIVLMPCESAGCTMADMASEKAVAELKEKYPELSIYKSKDTYLEIMDGQANKADAVKILCDSMNINIKHSISFGDNYNDIDMLKTTGKSYAMGNAPEEVKMQADYVTLDNNNEGIFEVLKKYSFK